MVWMLKMLTREMGEVLMVEEVPKNRALMAKVECQNGLAVSQVVWVVVTAALQ